MSSLPSVLRTPLGQPLFVLGVIFILAVYFFPKGVGGLFPLRLPARRSHHAAEPVDGE